MNRLVSLIMTVYNREKYLHEAISSVLKQTYTNFELLVWDDGSQDNSLEIALSLAEQDPRCRVIQGEHSGHSKALQSSILQSRGEFIGWVDSDDQLIPEALEETVMVLQMNPEVGLVYTNYLLINEQSCIIGEGERCKIPYSPQRILQDFMTFHFRLIRRQVFEQVGGINTDFVYAQDYDLCLRMSEVTKFFHLNRPLYLYRNHQNNISHQKHLEQAYFMNEAVAQAKKRREKVKHFPSLIVNY
ncbi:MAG: glycosyltransferase [Bacteroidota bacterium]